MSEEFWHCVSVNGTIKKTGLEWGKVQSLLGSTGGTVTALLIGSGDAASLGGFGANKVLHVDADARNVVIARALPSDRFSFTSIGVRWCNGCWLGCFCSCGCSFNNGVQSQS